MRRSFKVALAIVLWTLTVIAAVLAEAFWLGPKAIPRGGFPAIEKRLVQTLADAERDRRLGSAALVLIHRGRVATIRGFGTGNAEKRAAVDPERTLYQLASVSKAVTAWGVMKLVQDGKVGLDEPVLRYMKRWRFPGSSAHREKVTVRHLLSHTAGLDDGLGYGGFGPGEPIQTLEESLTLTKDSTVGQPRAVTVDREPGQAMAYSGGGYTVLQLLVEEVTQRPFAEYMKAEVLQPLGMTTASFEFDSVAAQDLATSFDREGKTHPPRRYTATAAVSLYASARDVAQFALAFVRENPVLRKETFAEMLQPQAGTGGTWALGHTLFVDNGAGGHVVGHDGGTYPAWGAVMRVNPATGNGVVLLVTGARLSISRLGDEWIYWETGRVRPEARRQIVYDRLKHALIAIVLGVVVILVVAKRMR